jgi:hypothetical protein
VKKFRGIDLEKLLNNLSHLMNHREQAGDEGFSELMAKILSRWPEVGWELGPDLIDPGIDRLSLSVDDMPELRTNPSLPLQGEGWMISLGIPPRDWEIYFEAKMNGKDLNIEGSEWFWTIVDVDPEPEAEVDKQVMITIAPSSQFGNLTDDELAELAGIIVTGELGESNVSRLVRWIDVSSTRQGSAEWSPMESLRKKFVEKFPDCEYGGWLATSR